MKGEWRVSTEEETTLIFLENPFWPLGDSKEDGTAVASTVACAPQ
jgi:hypothetical protein